MNIIFPGIFQPGVKKVSKQGSNTAVKASFDEICAVKALKEAGEAVIPESHDGFCFSPVSDGGKNLSPSEREYLSSQYDVNNMTMEEKHKLLGRLTIFGALSGQDLMTALERDTGLTDVLENDVRPVEGAEGVFSGAVAFDYEDDEPIDWVLRHQELATEEFQKFVFSRQQGGSTIGIGGELDSRIASLLRQLVRQ